MRKWRLDKNEQLSKTRSSTENNLRQPFIMAESPSPQNEKNDSNEQSRQVSKAVTFDEEAQRHPSSAHDSISARQWISKWNRKETKLETRTIQSRAFRHMYIFRRPFALQYYNPEDDDRPAPSESSENRLVERRSSRDSEVSEQSGREGRSTDDYLKQLSRVELFIDLIFVGIIANLSATFGEQAFGETGVTAGQATGIYLLLFLPVWRLWDYLREYGSNFYRDDYMQRLFYTWILVLCVLYGINAPFAYKSDPDEPTSLKLLIAVYLVARGSFLLAWGWQVLYIPFLRRQFAFQAAGTFLVAAFWIPAMFVDYPHKLIFLCLANGLEQPIASYLASPYGQALIAGGWVRYPDVDHYVERHEGFFIIVLGEGVFRLIDESPSGMGLTAKSGTVLTALLLYYNLHWLYFNGDQCKDFVHAVRRTWWKPVIWKFLHIILFASLLSLAASVLFLVQNEYVYLNPTGPDNSDITHEVRDFVFTAMWSASLSLTITVVSMTGIALLNRNLDKPKTLLVNSRYLRLGLRIPAIVVIMCLPLFNNINGGEWCGGATTTMYIVFMWEFIASLEKGWQWWEPKQD